MEFWLALTLLVPLSQGDGYLPRKKGTQLVYRSGTVEIVQTVLGREKLDGRMCIVIEKRGARGRERTWIEPAPTGLLLRQIEFEGQKTHLRTPAVLLKLPPREGEKWKAEIPYRGQLIQFRYHIVGRERIQVLAGNYLCWKVRIDGDAQGTKFRGHSWFAPGVGLVKQSIGTLQVELKQVRTGR